MTPAKISAQIALANPKSSSSRTPIASQESAELLPIIDA
jgi:hypothetical protein